MLKVLQAAAALVFCLYLLTACFFNSGTENVVDDYQVTWINNQLERSLYKHEKIIPPYIYAVSVTPRFLIAKQYPYQPRSGGQLNVAVTQYYIVERTKSVFQDKPVYGPLTEAEFKKSTRTLMLNNVLFTRHYPLNLKKNIAAR